MKRAIIITKLRPIGGAQRVAIQQAKMFNLEKIYYLDLKRDKLDGINFIPILFIESISTILKSNQIYTHSTFAGWFGRLFAFCLLEVLQFITHFMVLMHSKCG